MISVREYQPADYRSVKELYLQSDTFGGLFDEDRDSIERMNSQSEADSQSILVCEENGQIVGTVSLLENKRFAWLIRFAVKNELVSHALFEAAAKILKDRGHSQVLVYAPANESKFSDRYTNLNFNAGSRNYITYWRSLK